MNNGLEYVLQIQLEALPERWLDVARALTPEGAAELVRVMLTHRNRDTSVLRIDVRESHASER